MKLGGRQAGGHSLTGIVDIKNIEYLHENFKDKLKNYLKIKERKCCFEILSTP